MQHGEVSHGVKKKKNESSLEGTKGKQGGSMRGSKLALGCFYFYVNYIIITTTTCPNPSAISTFHDG